MRPDFHPRMVNSPFGDPGVFVPLSMRRQAVLFDLGDISALSPGDMLKTSHIFVSHTHMDHFIGFDPMVRLLLGRDKELHIYGPGGFLDKIEAKLGGYTWNLVGGYETSLKLIAHEIQKDKIIVQTYDCKSGFMHTDPKPQPWTTPIILKEPSFNVSAAILEHRIDCLGFCMEEHFHLNILKNKLAEMGLPPGSWINDLKSKLYSGADPYTQISVPCTVRGTPQKHFTLKELADKITLVTPGQKIAYITDVAYTPSNENKIIALAINADHLFIEATFLEQHRDLARAKCHLTAHQAGTIARKAQVKRLTLFHHSPRYTDQAHLLEDEALKAFGQQ